MAASNVDKQSDAPDYEKKLELMDNADRMCETVTKESKDVPLVPLNTPWTFWIDRSVRGTTVQQYESSLTKIYTVDTVQGFWSVYNHIPEPSKLSIRYSYHLMRAQRRPVWEDEENSEGGNWTFKCKKQDTEDVWKQLLLAAIGEQLSDCMSEEDDIIGISVSIRDRDDLILIWNNLASHKDDAKIIKKVKELLPHVTFTTIFYKAFNMHEAFEGKRSNRIHPR
ncbi:Eukaryotic translation initiation factor 4E type 3 [Biomphalaria glabrata]|uniref:Eukaryotic translation initiation factor 4E type 3-like n=1 Tax=Biomphalaria glabrata TaxID=6526 RepID=A0A9W3A3A6_BIOGL|nr:eukaryotic translation initiation factor 4E type 3-like [Biomphalaria glabrata]KAI8739560.1 eukaryotic translation initiation factor 4E type 3-like [Biomphalaria glabrata]KAI8771825.1 eukaryotic translation initiation factor 4E type 3 [Biomphalaria glabrata]